MNKLTRLGIASLLVATVFPLGLAQSAGGDAEAASQTQALEQYLKVIRGDLVAKRDSALKALLQLTENEAKMFWPLKEAYDADLKKLGEDRLELIREYGKVYDKLTPEKAQELAERSFALDEKRNALRRMYFKRISVGISPVIAVQFIQLQRQFETMGDLKVATNLPLAVR